MKTPCLLLLGGTDHHLFKMLILLTTIPLIALLPRAQGWGANTMFVLFDPIFWAQLGLSDPFFWEFGIKTRNILNFYAWYNRIKQA